MTRRRLSVALVVLVLLGAVPATAQTNQQERLAGVTGAEVVIEELNDGSASCGVTTADLTTATTRALLDNGLAVNPEADLDGLGPAT